MSTWQHQPSESVYYMARGFCLHQVGHLEDLASKLGEL